MVYSKRASGLIIAVAGMLLVEFGFSVECSNELINKIQPVLGALPGLLTAWYGSMTAKGGMTLGGFRK